MLAGRSADSERGESECGANCARSTRSGGEEFGAGPLRRRRGGGGEASIGDSKWIGPAAPAVGEFRMLGCAGDAICRDEVRPGGTGTVWRPDLVIMATSCGEAIDESDEITIGDIGATVAVTGLSVVCFSDGRKVCNKREIASAAMFVSEETCTKVS